ncbi:hypothetical protein FAZ15_11285 [Sphingobacterium olei]|uniref:DUF1449 family protein n=1 Tax=Sphingobacterium olei TaxID=2571155 RepID=A0A4U0PD43_9SPHI|nr:hypothetical protein [Sphingobacterium olei]TJZ60574.1 hypothetical protein FAZ15_11285 [Sphingobacterium olei]
MAEILNLLFNPLPNAIMTVLTGLSLLYWLLTMFLGDGFDFGDANIDIDFDGADIQDIDAPDDLDAEADAQPSFLSKAMDFINIGKAPLMVIVTLFKFIGWMITIASTFVFNLSSYGWKSVFVLLPIFLLTYFLMHYVTIPVVKLYKNVGYLGEEALDFLGRTGRMRSTIQGESVGSAEFIIDKDVIRLNVKSRDGETINYGDDIIVIDETQDKKYYYVTKDINLNNI